MHKKAEKIFNRLSFAGIVSLFLLILAGGVVRSSGAGMGCPDWPKCFNCWIPPTNVKDLPAGYREVYLAKRLKKNQRAAAFFSWLGFKKLAFSIQHQPSVYLAEDFNVTKAYTEYINRLIGVVTGFIFFGAWFCSFTYLKQNASVFWSWTAALFLIGFQGWLGSIVVSSNLDSGLITVHMLLAILTLTFAIYCFAAVRLGYKILPLAMPVIGLVEAGGEARENKRRLSLKIALGLTIVTSVAQIVMGTRVRELLDVFQGTFDDSAPPPRDSWVATVGQSFTWHRDSSILVALGAALVGYLVHRVYKGETGMLRRAHVNLGLIVLQILLGISLAYMGLPPFSQALHIFVATLLFGNMVYMYFMLKEKGVYIE